jgi:predicted phage terminase large subunit-like protein
MQLGDVWTQLKLPAFAEAEDPLGRPEGAALWPEWQDEAALTRRRKEVGERAFTALYQQNPKPPDAALFKVEKIRFLPEAPALLRSIRAWDLAASLPAPGRNPDYTVGLKLAKTQDGRLVVLDIVRMQASPAQVQAKILAVARADGPGTVVALPQDPGQAGLAQVMALKNALMGFEVKASPETGAKIIRATPAAIQVDAESLWLLAAPWNESFLSELSAFPDSLKDDQVDALSRAVNTLVTTNDTVTRRFSVPLLNR